MRKSAWRSELKRLILIFVLGVIIGLFSGSVAAVLAIFFAGYSCWFIYQVSQLDQWFESADSKVPEASGVWGRVLDQVYHTQRREKEARQELQAIIDRSRASVNAFSDGVILVDPNGHLEWWNTAAGEMLGLRYEDDQGQAIGNLIRDPSFKDYFPKKAYDVPLIIGSPTKNLILQMQFTLFGRGDRLILVQDITRLQHLEEMRSDFVANVSHELKTPLTVLRGYLETFLDHMDGFDTKWHRPLKSMDEQALRMDGLVNDLLLLSRLESGKDLKEEQALDISALINAVRLETEILANNKQQRIEVSIEAGCKLQGSYHEIQSTISNLLVNAIKYSPAGRLIRIYWRLNADNTGAQLMIEDNGMGIDPKHISRLTERFYRAEQSRSTDTGGTGLGLAIVKHVMIRHGGTLKVESILGRGSRFICCFPVKRLISESVSLS